MSTSECFPFSKTGGLADVVPALSEALLKIGIRADVFMPFYSFIDRSEFSKVMDLRFETLGTLEKCAVYECERNKVRYFALEHPYFSERSGIYGESSFLPYRDNLLRYGVFSKATALFSANGPEQYSIVHLHDWTTSLVPLFLKTIKSRAKTVFTIHNLAYQGVFSPLDAISIGTPLNRNYILDGKINLLKGAILESDYVTTVSPTYAKEIQTEELGCSLDKYLRERKDSLAGIINGIDLDVWNPETDPMIYKNYSVEELDDKKKNKKALQKDLGLEKRDDIPLIGMISRLASQKGFEELLFEKKPSALERLLKRGDVQFAIIGSGDERYEKELISLETKYSNLKVIIGYSVKSSHRIEAASDFFLMPSIYEPCGLNQLYSERYGTLPIAHRTGGLKDTIIDADENSNSLTGFLFDEVTSDEIVKKTERAINFYKERERMKRAIKNAMSSDFSWNNSALEYKKIYNLLTKSLRRS